MENQCGWHGVAPDDEQYEQAMKELDEQLKKFGSQIISKSGWRRIR